MRGEGTPPTGLGLKLQERSPPIRFGVGYLLAIGLLGAGCAMTRPESVPSGSITAKRPISAEASVSRSAAETSLQARIPILVQPAVGAVSDETDPAVMIKPVQVQKSVLVPYVLRMIQSAQDIRYGQIVLMRERPGHAVRFIRWAEPGHWNQAIEQIEGRDVVSMTLREAQDILNRAEDPVHLTVGSAHGARIIECFSRAPDMPSSTVPMATSVGPVKSSP